MKQAIFLIAILLSHAGVAFGEARYNVRATDAFECSKADEYPWIRITLDEKDHTAVVQASCDYMVGEGDRDHYSFDFLTAVPYLTQPTKIGPRITLQLSRGSWTTGDKRASEKVKDLLVRKGHRMILQISSEGKLKSTNILDIDRNTVASFPLL